MREGRSEPVPSGLKGVKSSALSVATPPLTALFTTSDRELTASVVPEQFRMF